MQFITVWVTNNVRTRRRVTDEDRTKEEYDPDGSISAADQRSTYCEQPVLSAYESRFRFTFRCDLARVI